MFTLLVALLLSLAVMPLMAVLLLFCARWLKIKSSYKQALTIELLQYASILAAALVLVLLLQDAALQLILSSLVSVASFIYFAKLHYKAGTKKIVWLYLLFQLSIIVFGVVASVLIRSFVFMPFYVAGDSMLPTFIDKDYLLVERFNHNYQRGDIIIFADKDSSQYYIKRIIGLPGETVLIKKSGLYIATATDKQGKKLDEPYLAGKVTRVGKQNTFKVPAGQYFVLGDNRLEGSDSREYGPIAAGQIIGKFWFKIDLTN